MKININGLNHSKVNVLTVTWHDKTKKNILILDLLDNKMCNC